MFISTVLVHTYWYYVSETVPSHTGCGRKNTRFGRVIALGGERIQWWGARRRTAVYVPFSVYTMVWLGEH